MHMIVLCFLCSAVYIFCVVTLCVSYVAVCCVVCVHWVLFVVVF